MTVSVAASNPLALSARARLRVSPRLAELVSVVGLLALALAARLPGLLLIPRFGDEQLDVLYTMPLYRLQGLPLVAFDPYNGALFSYLLAVMLWVVGPYPWTPRLLSMLLAVATVGLTYWLGRSLGGPIAGLVAGGLLLFSAVHILINSHIAWSNATTPFFTTLAFCT